MDTFFLQENCDRCGRPLYAGRTMSMFNTDCICIDCSNKEKKRPDYQDAVNEELRQIATGNWNYLGIYHGCKNF